MVAGFFLTTFAYLHQDTFLTTNAYVEDNFLSLPLLEF